MIAVGVASPKAQGQATTRTATVAPSAFEGSRQSQKASRGRREGEHDRDEPRRPQVGQPLGGGLRPLRLADHPDDLGEDGVVAGAVEAYPQRAGSVERPADHRIAGLLVHGDALAGQHRFVDRARPLEDRAVRGDPLARA
jgi:hypothetical protein